MPGANAAVRARSGTLTDRIMNAAASDLSDDSSSDEGVLQQPQHTDVLDFSDGFSD